MQAEFVPDRTCGCMCFAFRARLSYEQFSQFLVAIKDLNAGRTSREDTLGSAKALFGSNNTDLYGECCCDCVDICFTGAA